MTTSEEEKRELRKEAYEKGLRLSQKNKNYKYWDKFVEPFIIKQFGFFFGLSHSFIKGMISDNKVSLDDSFDKTIKENQFGEN